MTVCSCSYAFWTSTSIASSGGRTVTLILRSKILIEIASTIPIWTSTSTSETSIEIWRLTVAGIEVLTGIGMAIATGNKSVTEILIWIQVDVVLFDVALLEILACECKKTSCSNSIHKLQDILFN